MRLLDYLYSIEGSTYNYYGPPAGSDDLLGKVKGYKLSDDGTRPVYLDVIDGTRESDYDYRVNSLYISQEMPGDSRGTILNALRLGGAENPSYPQLNLDDPDDHYRYLVYQAQNAFLVPQLPIAFFDSDQMVKLTDLRTLISNYVKSESAKFIVGQSDIDDPVQVEKFRSDLMSLGYEEYRQMYVDVYAEYVSSLQ